MKRGLALLLLLLTFGNAVGVMEAEAEETCTEDCGHGGAEDCCPPFCHVSCCGAAIAKGLPPGEPSLPGRFATGRAAFGLEPSPALAPPPAEILHVPRSIG